VIRGGGELAKEGRRIGTCGEREGETYSRRLGTSYERLIRR